MKIIAVTEGGSYIAELSVTELCGIQPSVDGVFKQLEAGDTLDIKSTLEKMSVVEHQILDIKASMERIPLQLEQVTRMLEAMGKGKP